MPWHHHTKWHLNTVTNGLIVGSQLVAVGTVAGMSKDRCIVIAQDIEKCVKDMLGKYI